MTATIESIAVSFVDRRGTDPGEAPGRERRQFANSHDDLSPAARELAQAVDRYKLINRRRFITYDEILNVVQSLGYRKP
ncbi:MAG TPA: hypothetical protein VKB78_09975 [Pirellulales bacterium]|nr:hypothetical protein [Pirellulales bacterium]